MPITFSWIPLREFSKDAKAGELPTINETTLKEIRTLFAATSLSCRLDRI